MSSVKRGKAVIVSIVAVFAALHTLLGIVPGIWRSWMILIQPIEGALLGPYAGFLAALIGSVLSRFIRPRVPIMFIFGLGEPVGAMVAGLAFKSMYSKVLLLYAVMLGAYFLHPLGRELPAWCLWDVYLAFALAAVLFLARGRTRGLDKRARLVVAAILGNEADVLTRIFLFIPFELYKVLGVSEKALPAIWVAGALETPIELGLAVLAAVVGGIPLLMALDKSRIIEYPVT